VVVRRLAGSQAGRQLYSDVLGTLLGFDEVATVQTAAGPVEVPVEEIAVAKRVPPPLRPRGADIAALEWIANAAWPAPHTARLSDWLLRAAAGWTGRANSVLPLGDPGRPLDTALDEIVAWYDGFGLPARINVPLPLRIDLDRELDERGWARSPRTLVQVADLDRLPPGGEGIVLAAQPSPTWLAMMAGVKGELPPVARAVLTGPEQVRFASLTDADGAPVAIGRGVVGDGHLQLGLIQVAPQARRRGLARQVIGALAGWAGTLGARRAYLQVEERNTAATTLYGSLGFTTHHSYFTRTAPKSATSPTDC
jgi:GNAT superfamily N-acetyltransferase